MEVKKELDVKNMYHFLENYCEQKQYKNSLIALPFAKEVHQNQKRLGGEPYIIHPLSVAFFTIGVQLDSDTIISGSLLHDTVEDQNADLDLIDINEDIKKIVYLLTFVKKANMSKEECLDIYYENIRNNIEAIMLFLLKK